MDVTELLKLLAHGELPALVAILVLIAKAGPRLLASWEASRKDELEERRAERKSREDGIAAAREERGEERRERHETTVAATAATTKLAEAVDRLCDEQREHRAQLEDHGAKLDLLLSGLGQTAPARRPREVTGT